MSAAPPGQRYWRSLDQLAATPEFRRRLETEFPHFAALVAEGVDRRSLLRFMGASLMMSGLAACSPEVPKGTLVPPVLQPDGIVPGGIRHYSSAIPLDGYATGVLVRHESTRPIKVDGNPAHPASLGATDALIEASILDLYDPDRAQAVTYGGRIRGWELLVRETLARVNALTAQKQGAKLRILSGAVTSPLLAAQLAALEKAVPGARRHQWQAIGRDEVLAGAVMAFGRPLDAVPHLDKADIVLGIGSDLFSSAPGHLRFARDFAGRRDAVANAAMSRLYAVESTPTLFGAAADHRFVLNPAEVDRFVRGLAAALGGAPADWAWTDGPSWQAGLARDLAAHRGRALIHVGAEQPAFLHALAHLVNHALAAPADLIPSVAVSPVDQAQSLRELVSDMAAGQVDTLIVLGGNPGFTAPADLDFAAAMKRVPHSLSLSPYRDETAELTAWHVPERHIFEQWTDTRGFDGTASIVQPQVRPFYDGRSAHALVALLTGAPGIDERAMLQQAWGARWGSSGDAFATQWREALRSGIVADSAATPVTVAPRDDFLAKAPAPVASGSGLTVLFRADEGLWDGRFANNGWLQELPRPFSKLTWDNAALIAPQTARRLGLANEDRVELSLGQRMAQLAVWIMPGQATDCVTLPLGFGRRLTGQVGEGAGTDVYPLRLAANLWTAPGMTARRLAGTHPLAATQLHHVITDDKPVRIGSLADFLKNPGSVAGEKPSSATLYTAKPEQGAAAWGMTIDTGTCIGCNACVVACQAENNIPVVGKEQVLLGREMQWLRVDLYYGGQPETPESVFQPVPCMHCEDAPCEVVCPVGATNHDAEGLNVMVYNRCVGTRFCSNNCPYKVRRFNFLAYSEEEPRPPAARNADVTVRSRGVMEKCTYCLQRIAEARIDADREDRPIRDGEVVTACQAACPTRAISFGDLHDPASAVRHKKESPLNYELLGELNTRPRTTYAARLKNRNPDTEQG